MNEAALRVRQREDEVKSVSKVSEAPAPPLTAVRSPAAHLGAHGHARAGRGTRGCTKQPRRRATRAWPPSRSPSVWQLSSQQYEEGERALREARRIESNHQSRLRSMQQRLERAQQQEEQLHQANTPSPSLLGLGLPCQGPDPPPTASLSLSAGAGAGAAEPGSPEETA